MLYSCSNGYAGNGEVTFSCVYKRLQNTNTTLLSFSPLYRSQLAMKFLDPAFTSLNNALNEDLQGKSSKWKFNRTAYLDQR